MVQRIELRGKYATGEYRFALVDDKDYGWLNQSRWKAKWNGGKNNVYAVRNVTIKGKNHTLRMHREVFGLQRSDRREIDHIDHNALNNTLVNLRVASRSQNVLNSKPRLRIFQCESCGKDCVQKRLTTFARVCEKCRARIRETHYQTREHVVLALCGHCGGATLGKTRRKEFCSDRCRNDQRIGREDNRNLRIRSHILTVMNQPCTSVDLAIKAQCSEATARRWIRKLISGGLLMSVRRRSNAAGGNVYKKV